MLQHATDPVAVDDGNYDTVLSALADPHGELLQEHVGRQVAGPTARLSHCRTDTCIVSLSV